jgi:hypothetical protein
MSAAQILSVGVCGGIVGDGLHSDDPCSISATFVAS